MENSMKKIILCISFLLSSFVIAQDQVFLSCQGILNQEMTTTNMDGEKKTKTADSIGTDITIDKQAKVLNVQYGPMKICVNEEICKCKFNNNSYVCNAEWSIGNEFNNIRDSKTIEISRKSGLLTFSRVLTSSTKTNQTFNNNRTVFDGRFQCKTVTKNLF